MKAVVFTRYGSPNFLELREIDKPTPKADLWWPWIAMTSDKRIRVLALKPNKGLTYMNELFESGDVSPVIDGSYDLSQTREAFRYFDSGRHKGKLVITVYEAQ